MLNNKRNLTSDLTISFHSWHANILFNNEEMQSEMFS